MNRNNKCLAHGSDILKESISDLFLTCTGFRSFITMEIRVFKMCYI